MARCGEPARSAYQATGNQGLPSQRGIKLAGSKVLNTKQANPAAERLDRVPSLADLD